MKPSVTPKVKYRFPMNLQFFALDKDGVDDNDVDNDDAADNQDEQDLVDELGNDEIEFDDGDDLDDTDADTDDDSDDDTAEDDDQSSDDEDEQDEKSGNKGKGKNDTAAAVIAERRKWQAKLSEATKSNGMLQKLLKLSGASSLDELQTRLDRAEAAEIAKRENITPEEAQRRVDENRRLEKLEQDIRRQKYDLEFQALTKDPFFAGIETAREELEDMAERTGLSIKQAYYSLYGEQRLKDRETEIESRVKANREKRQKRKVDTSTTASSGKAQTAKKLNLTPEQQAAAEYGVKKGHFKSIEEYARYLRS